MRKMTMPKLRVRKPYMTIRGANLKSRMSAMMRRPKLRQGTTMTFSVRNGR